MKIGPEVLEKKMFKETVDGQRKMDEGRQTKDDGIRTLGDHNVSL